MTLGLVQRSALHRGASPADATDSDAAVELTTNESTRVRSRELDRVVPVGLPFRAREASAYFDVERSFTGRDREAKGSVGTNTPATEPGSRGTSRAASPAAAYGSAQRRARATRCERPRGSGMT